MRPAFERDDSGLIRELAREDDAGSIGGEFSKIIMYPHPD